MDSKELKEYWLEAKNKIKCISQCDKGNVRIFGANIPGGHQFKILPVVSEKKILTFEKKNQITLHPEYRTFLQYFGAGGPGPCWGIYDFRKKVYPYHYSDSFPYDRTIDLEEVTEDDPVWDKPGLAEICSAGCGSYFYIELNGSRPGRIWCLSDGSWEMMIDEERFIPFFSNWLDKIYTNLQRLNRLQKLLSDKDESDLNLKTVSDYLECNYNVVSIQKSGGNREEELWAYLDTTPARLLTNEKLEVIYIDYIDYIGS